jgi:hypothetical protein
MKATHVTLSVTENPASLLINVVHSSFEEQILTYQFSIFSSYTELQVITSYVDLSQSIIVFISSVIANEHFL